MIYVPWTEGHKQYPSDFVHPGLWHSHDDLETMRNGVLAGKKPWKTGFDQFANSSFSQSTYKIQGPYAVISRGAISNYTSFANDARAAYHNAIMCTPFPISYYCPEVEAGECILTQIQSI